MRQAVLADTGPLFALRDIDDSYHLQARHQLQQFRADSVSVIVVVSTLLESHRLILNKLGIGPGRAFLEEMGRTAAFVNPDLEEYRRAMGTVRRFHDQKITLADALLAEVSLRLEVPVWTFDRHFDVMRVPVWRS